MAQLRKHQLASALMLANIHGGEVMAAPSSRWRLAGLVFVAAVVGTGCNPLLLPYFLIPGLEPKNPPEIMHIADEKGKEVKVVILATAPVETGTEFIRVDRELSNILARHLQEYFKETKERVTIVSPRKVEKFKDDHPDWQAMGLADVGKEFHADYVIYLEIQNISLFERNSANLMYRGNVGIDVAVVDTRRPDDGAVTKHIGDTYPTGARGPVLADERNLADFRQTFLEHVGTRLSWCFVPHPLRDEV
jgi:hypothetical protein